MSTGHIKTRIMFTKNTHVAQGLTTYQRENKYNLLYYQFIKHAFGFQHTEKRDTPTNLRILLDELPDSKMKNDAFKNHLLTLNNQAVLRNSNIRILSDGIGEIDSKNHVLLQCLDVVLGAMQFRLNDKHLEKPLGAKQRGKRTIAKEKLYKYIRRQVCEWYPNFNIGVSTSVRGDTTNLWNDPYRHWMFVPSNYKLDPTQSKSYLGD